MPLFSPSPDDALPVNPWPGVWEIVYAEARKLDALERERQENVQRENPE